MLGIEIVRACILYSNYNLHEYQLIPNEMDEMHAIPPAENRNNDVL